MAMASPRSRINSRRPIPCPIPVPANPAAIPVAKGFTVEPSTPAPAPSRITLTAVTVSACKRHMRRLFLMLALQVVHIVINFFENLRVLLVIVKGKHVA